MVLLTYKIYNPGFFPLKRLDNKYVGLSVFVATTEICQEIQKQSVKK